MVLEKTNEADLLISKLSGTGFSQSLIIWRKIEELGQNLPQTSHKLLAYLEHPDYLMRSRLFIALGRIRDKTISQKLLDYIKIQNEEEWQLRALECLYHLSPQGIIPCLRPLIYQPVFPLAARGAVWLIGYLGGEAALATLLEFAASPKNSLIKSEITMEAIALAVKSLEGQVNEQIWQEMIRKNPQAKNFFLYTTFPEVVPPRFFIYPYPDYLLERAKIQGIRARDFKKLYYIPRFLS